MVQDAVPPDSIRAALQEVFASGNYEWTARREPWALFRRLYSGLVSWLDVLQREHPVAYTVLLIFLVALLVTILVHFVYLIFRALRPRAPESQAPSGRQTAVRDSGWFLNEARRCEREGRYVESLALRFHALVLVLDGKRIVKFHPSMTPAEYVREARLDGAGRDGLQSVVLGLYGHVFGGATIVPDDLIEFDRRAAELTASIATG